MSKRHPRQEYSIQIASDLSSVSADTLRMWERRYGVPKPRRNARGRRVYAEEDVHRLQLVASAIRAGCRVGDVIRKPRRDLERLVATPRRLGISDNGQAPTVDSIVGTLAADNPLALHAELRRAALVLGPMKFVTDLAAPLVTRVGELWAANELKIRHEHLMSEALTGQLRVLASAYQDDARAPNMLLATLPNEPHALGVEMMSLYLPLAGRFVSPCLLGVSLPRDQIADAARALRIDVVALSVSSASDHRVAAKDLRWLLRELPRRTQVWAGGAGAAAIRIDEAGFRAVTTWSDVDAALRAWPQS